MSVPSAIRLGELILIAITFTAELTALASIIHHVGLPLAVRRARRHGKLMSALIRRDGRIIAWMARHDRRVTTFERRIHGGRAVRALGFMFFMIGATHALVSNFDDPITIRSLCWILGTTCAFVSWMLLDRGRWEIGVT